MIDLAFIYYEGSNQDKVEGYPKCLYYCSLKLLTGDGVPIDKEEAMKLMKKAADPGNPDAINQYGLKLNDGDGIQQNEADKGQSYDMHNYGLKLYKEEVVKGKKTRRHKAY